MRLIDADALKEKLRKLQRWIVRKDNSHNEGFTYDQVFFAIDAQPEQKTGRWIPVTEQLPEVDENVLVSYHFDADTEFPPFDGVTISYWTGVKNHNIPHFADMGDACTVLAWMPLPEPYKEDSDGRPD